MMKSTFLVAVSTSGCAFNPPITLPLVIPPAIAADEPPPPRAPEPPAVIPNCLISAASALRSSLEICNPVLLLIISFTTTAGLECLSGLLTSYPPLLIRQSTHIKLPDKYTCCQRCSARIWREEI